MAGWAAKATHGVRPRAITFGENGANALGRAALTPQVLADTDKNKQQNRSISTGSHLLLLRQSITVFLLL